MKHAFGSWAHHPKIPWVCRFIDWRRFCLTDCAAFPMLRASSRAIARQQIHSGGASMRLLSSVSFSAERRSSPGLEWNENVGEVTPCRTSPGLRKTPHLTEDGRALPTL